MNDTNDILLSPPEVQKILRCGRNTIYQVFNRPDFPKIQIGNKNYFITKTALHSWIEKQQSNGYGERIARFKRLGLNERDLAQIIESAIDKFVIGEEKRRSIENTPASRQLAAAEKQAERP